MHYFSQMDHHHHTLDAATREFIDRLGVHFEGDGLPRIAGQVLGLLLISREPRCLDHIAELLQVSKASASSNARLLERVGLIEQTALPGDRRDYYQLGEDPEGRLLSYRLRLLSETRDVMRLGLETPAAEDSVICRRLHAVTESLTAAMNDLLASAERRHCASRNHKHQTVADTAG